MTRSQRAKRQSTVQRLQEYDEPSLQLNTSCIQLVVGREHRPLRIQKRSGRSHTIVESVVQYVQAMQDSLSGHSAGDSVCPWCLLDGTCIFGDGLSGIHATWSFADPCATVFSSQMIIPLASVDDEKGQRGGGTRKDHQCLRSAISRLSGMDAPTPYLPPSS
jgi:hypothetical protein